MVCLLSGPSISPFPAQRLLIFVVLLVRLLPFLATQLPSQALLAGDCFFSFSFFLKFHSVLLIPHDLPAQGHNNVRPSYWAFLSSLTELARLLTFTVTMFQGFLTFLSWVTHMLMHSCMHDSYLAKTLILYFHFIGIY